MSEWKGNGSAQELRIGDIQAVAGVNGTAIVYASVERTAPRQLGMDAAKSAAEQALREMHDALAEHFAPVLRWEKTAAGRVATIGPWELYARDRLWSVRIATSPGRYEHISSSTRDYSSDAAQAERDAIAKLRALGVPFRVEGES